MRSLALGLSAALVLVGCSIQLGFPPCSTWAEETEEFDLPAEGIRTLTCSSRNGSIEVAAAAGTVDTIHASATAGTIHVRAHKRASGCDEADARAALAAIGVERKIDGSTCDVHAEWRESRRATWGSVVSFTLALPASLAVKLESHNGALEVDGVAGACRLVSHNGELRVRGPSPSVAAETHNGAIHYDGSAEHLELSSHNGSVDVHLTGRSVEGSIRTSNGAVDLVVDPSVAARVTGDTGHGGISVSVPTSHCTIERRHFELDLAGGGRDLRVSTSNGSLSIH